MALFWSKKSKAEKIYDKAAKPATKNAPSKTTKAVKAAAKPMKKAVATKVAASSGMAVTVLGSFGSAAGAILRPHITEKSGILSQLGVYTFQVTKNANKATVAKAIAALYKVTPVKVAMINLPSKSIVVKGRLGAVPAIRKAVVTVKKGDKIDFA